MISLEKVGKTVDDAVKKALDELKLTREQVEVKVLSEPKNGFFGLFGGRDAKVLVTPKLEDLKAATAEAEEKLQEALDSTGGMIRSKVEEVKETGKEFNEAVKAKIHEATAPAKEEEAPAPKAEPKAAPAEFVVDEEAVKTAKAFLAKVFEAMKMKVVMEKFVNKEDECVVLKLHGENMGILIGKHGQTLDALQYLTNLSANKESETHTRIVIDVENYRERRAVTLTRLAKRLAEKVKRNGERVVLEPMNPHERKIIHTALQNDSQITTLSEGSDPFRKVVIQLKK